MSVLRTIVSSSRALVTGAKDVARFREIATVFVRHGFGWWVAQLKLRRELQVELEGGELTRAAVGSADTGKRLVAAFTQLGPTFVKLGQILSTRPDLLSDAVISELTCLQDQVSPLPFEQIANQLRNNLGPKWREQFADIDETPLASASIAQVHRATLKTGERVALKVQRPGLRPKIESDLNILLATAGYVEEAFPEAAAMDLGGVIRGFAKSLAQELDFCVEARNIARFHRNFADDDKVRVPLVFDALSTSEVLCMEFVEGRKFSEVLQSGEDTRPLVEVYFKTAYKMLFIDGFFHGDLHPGNVFVQEGGRLAIIDCGMVGRLSPSMKDKLIDILWAVMSEDMEALARSFYALAIPTSGKVDYAAFEADVVEIAERYLGGVPLSELQIGELFGELVAGATRHRVRMPTDFTMMFKAILTTEGLARSIAPDVDPLELARPFISQMIQDRYSGERIKQTLLADFHLLSRAAHSLPQRLPALLEDIHEGRLAVGLSPASLTALDKASERRMNQGVRAALTITCIACGTYALGLGLPATSPVGIPWISTLFYAAAAYGVIGLRWRS
ncbi:ABC1 kinase family protein [Nannocystis radixulma]|uniref:AarF/UbiB family protein n=1 Tax=Nannocystis radixulma TaxID=2995305 RepID=A0ABT5BDH2_9BACT|nr:AarF/UbiB family protein [Nannocystis radixulma]MDC0671107.1 AarF/UbiB family protein [Nannocystis radixulma]